MNDLPEIGNPEAAFLHYVKNSVLTLDQRLAEMQLEELQFITAELLHNISEKLSVLDITSETDTPKWPFDEEGSLNHMHSIRNWQTIHDTVEGARGEFMQTGSFYSNNIAFKDVFPDAIIVNGWQRLVPELEGYSIAAVYYRQGSIYISTYCDDGILENGSSDWTVQMEHVFMNMDEINRCRKEFEETGEFTSCEIGFKDVFPESCCKGTIQSILGYQLENYLLDSVYVLKGEMYTSVWAGNQHYNFAKIDPEVEALIKKNACLIKCPITGLIVNSKAHWEWWLKEKQGLTRQEHDENIFENQRCNLDVEYRNEYCGENMFDSLPI